MANPIIRLNIDGEQRIVVKPNPIEIIYTGSTGSYNFVQSGATVITQTGNTVTIFSPIPDSALDFIQSGATVITRQNEHVTIFTPVVTIPTNISAFSNDAGYITSASISQFWTSGQTVNYVQQEISGLTSTVNWGDIQGTLSNQVDLQQALNGKSNTGHTHSQYALQSTVTGLTTTLNNHIGDADIHFVMSGISITESQISNLKTYLTGVTWNIITGKPNLTLQSDFTGHTSNGNIHYPMSGISITKSQVTDFPALFTGHTFVASGATEIAVAGNQVTIYSPTGSTGGGLVIKVVTGTTYTLSDDDKDKVLEFTATGNTTLNLPSGIASGFQCNVVNMSGQIITLTKTGGGTLKTIGNFVRVRNRYGGVWIYLRATNDFLAQGDLS